MFNTSILRFPAILALLPCIVIAAGIGFIMAGSNYTWQGLIFVPLAIIVTACLLLPHMFRLDVWSAFPRILVTGLIVKLGFSLLRYWTTFGGITEPGDAARYNINGRVIAQHIWQLEFDKVIPSLQWGAKFVDFFTGAIYSVIGPSLIGIYLIYSFFAFLGSYFFYRAFRVAFPQGDKLLYGILIFFFPSLLFWANGLSKDALISLGIGLFAYGGAQLAKNQLQGLVPLGLGLLCTVWIRPHITAILALALVLALLIRGVGRGGARLGTFVIGILAIGGFFWFLLPRLATFLRIEELSVQGVLSFVQEQQSLAVRGGAGFQPADISNPLNFPMAVANVFFRPFLWDAHNILAMIQSLEGLIFLGVVLWRIKSLGKALASSFSNAYIRFILLFVFAFVVVFSLVGNFSILARERTMMLPFFFMLLAYAPSHTPIENRIQEVKI